MTDSNGDIIWTGLEPGIYLIYREKTRNPEYSGAPIILTVPQIMNKEIRYDVSVLPKFSKGDQGNDGEIDTDWEGTGPGLDTGTGGHPDGGPDKAHSPGTGDETVILPFVFSDRPILGVWWSIPISDTLSAITALIMLIIEIRKFRQLIAEQDQWRASTPPMPL